MRRSRASEITSRSCGLPAITAEMVSKCDSVRLAIIIARVVLPVPGGPHRMMEEKSRSASIARRRRRSCPTI